MAVPLLLLAAGLALADVSVVALALPPVLSELDTSVEGVAAVVGVYTAVLAVAVVPAALLQRRTGPEATGLVGALLVALSSVGCAAAQSLEVLLAFRGVQALGAALLLPAAFVALGGGGAGRSRWVGAAVLGTAAGPALGGVLTELLDWRAIFWVQVPVFARAAVALARVGWPARPPRAAADDTRRWGEAPRPAAALALAAVSAALGAVLFLLVLLLVAGWNVSPLRAAAAVSVLPLAAVVADRLVPDEPWRASAGCALVGGGTLALAFLPSASAWWTVAPQLLAGAGMGLALPSLAGGILPERDALQSAGLLALRHIGIAVTLAFLAPVAAADLEEATDRARVRGVALVLDSDLSPLDKIDLAPALLGGVDSETPRAELRAAVAEQAAEADSEDRAGVLDLGARTDDVLVTAVGEAFRTVLLVTGGLAFLAALAVFPGPGRRESLGVALVVSVAAVGAYAIGHAVTAPATPAIADPCEERELPDSGGLTGEVQKGALIALDEAACDLGSSREELVLGLSNEADAAEFERRYGTDPRSPGSLIDGLLG